MAKIKLFCFPYAGGSATIFALWKAYARILEGAFQTPYLYFFAFIQINKQLVCRFDKAMLLQSNQAIWDLFNDFELTAPAEILK